MVTALNLESTISFIDLKILYSKMTLQFYNIGRFGGYNDEYKGYK